ncbi:glycosyltransferase [Xylanimonas sp. McL0601]|uniref:glycosyltransferase n=1 Tax=Xylanimonas sp. McL0601 TaxID=3414739 RepID=UPI003CE8D39B
MILICTIALAGTTGLQKSVVECANALHRAGYPVAVLGFLGTSDGAHWALPQWPLDPGIPAYTLQTLAAERGHLLHRNYHPVLSGQMGTTRYEFTANQLAALRQLNGILAPDDTLIFTNPIPALAFHRGLEGTPRRPRTLLQVHGDYLHHSGLWQTMMGARDSIDKVQTVADGLRAQFSPVFDEGDALFIPNFQGPKPPLERIVGEGVNIVLPASFQDRKNQLDAVRALALVQDPSVQLTLWGRANSQNLYYLAVKDLVESLGLTERVHMPGFGSETDIYSAADIVLMTSRSEGFPYTLTEAAYYGIPTVSYDFEFGPREAIEDGSSGFIVPLGDVDGLAERLTVLAADAEVRARFGQRARAMFDERFSTTAVLARYQEVLGAPGGTVTDLAHAFGTDGDEPLKADAISHRSRLASQLHRHHITVTTDIELHDVQIDNGKRVIAPTVARTPGATHITFRAAGAEVISYTTAPGATDRHYLGNTTTAGEFEVLPYLRRDADYGDGSPPVVDTVFATSGGSRKVTASHLSETTRVAAKSVRRDVAWKLRQIAGNKRPSATSAAPPARDPGVPVAPDIPASPPPASVSAPAGAPPASVSAPAGAPQADVPAPAQASPASESGTSGSSRGSVGLGRASGMLRTAGRLGGVSLKMVAASMIIAATKRSAPPRREIARHPRFPVTAGTDSFGTPINQRGGVVVKNAGSARRPTVTITGEYDWLTLRDAQSERRITPPFSYGEFFERLCAAERDYGLFEMTTRGGTPLWEHGRSALVIQLAEAFGMWGAASALDRPAVDEYTGPKRLTTAPSARRVVFDYARRGQSDYRTAGFRDDATLFVVQPGPDGYPEVDDQNLVYPLHEYNQWRVEWRRRWEHQRAPEVDARPFEAALTEALGMPINLGDHLRNRLLKHLDERNFWTPVFERVQPDEVLVSASHWWSGVVAAAEHAGALVSDIQYADTGRYHASYWFGGMPRHGAKRLYTWSEFWAARTNVYQEHVVVPRQQPELAEAIRRGPSKDPDFDVCVISQPRVFRRIVAFVGDLVRERPELKVVIAPHPSQRPTLETELAAAGLLDKVVVSPDDTLTTVGRSRLSVGCYSTSLWESAAMGCPTYVIPVPGHELTLEDIESGLFRLARSPHDLVPFDVPASRHDIFEIA